MIKIIIDIAIPLIVIIGFTLFAIKNHKTRTPWVTHDEITRLEEIAKKRGEK